MPRLEPRLLSPTELIVKKREGERLSADEIRQLVAGFVAGRVADYQMSAWLMAALLRGLDPEETWQLTRAMLESGCRVKLGGLRAPKVDKHSTGGVGDKLSLCLAPLVAACGVVVPMVAGRGLGHTGGTLDKLESIAGYRTRLSLRQFVRILTTVGASIIGPTEQIAPADRRIYALRDVTGTVESVPLIVASILSKKLAVEADALVLDVKVGRGALMQTRLGARRLAQALLQVAGRAGRRVTALLTRMDQPTGRTIGNALEVREAIEVLGGAGPADTRELTLVLGAEMLVVAGACRTRDEARRALERALRSGDALERFRRMVEAHGGDPRVVDDPDRLPSAPTRIPVRAQEHGFVTHIDAYELGMVSVLLGAGRLRIEQQVDPAVGIELVVRPADRVAPGDPLCFLHARRREQTRPLVERTRGAFRIGSRPPPARPLVLERIES